MAQLLEGVVLLGFVKDLSVDIVDDAIPLARHHRIGEGLVFAHGVPELLEEHPVDLHPFVANGLFAYRGDDVGPEVLVSTINLIRPSVVITTDPSPGAG